MLVIALNHVSVAFQPIHFILKDVPLYAPSQQYQQLNLPNGIELDAIEAAARSAFLTIDRSLILHAHSERHCRYHNDSNLMRAN